MYYGSRPDPSSLSKGSGLVAGLACPYNSYISLHCLLILSFHIDMFISCILHRMQDHQQFILTHAYIPNSNNDIDGNLEMRINLL